MTHQITMDCCFESTVLVVHPSVVLFLSHRFLVPLPVVVPLDFPKEVPRVLEEPEHECTSFA